MTGRQLRQPAVLLSLVLLAGIAALWPSLGTLLRYWSEIPDYQHAWLLAPIVLAWIILVLRRMQPEPVVPSRGGLIALASVVVLWLVAQRASFDIAHQLLWPLAIGCGLWAAGGWRVAVRFAAPLGLLYLAIPVWDYLLPVLQRMSIFFSEHMLAALGVQATVTENRVTIPEGTFAIVEGCSGKRYLVVALAIAWLSAAVNHVRAARLAVLFGSAVMLALLINWIRIVVIIYAGHVTHMLHYLVAVEHLTLGNVLFLPLLAGILFAARWLGGPTLAPLSPFSPVPAGRFERWSFAPIVVFLVALVLVQARPEGAGSALRLNEAPLGAGSWEGPLPPRSGWMPEFAGSDDQRRVGYQSRGGEGVEVYVNFYADQHDGKEMVQYSNQLAAPAGWVRPWSQRGQALQTPQQKVLRSFEVRGADDQTWLIAYTYRVGSGLYTSDTAAKLAYGIRSMWASTPAGVVAVARSCDATNCDKARTLVADFWDNMSPPIMGMLPD